VTANVNARPGAESLCLLALFGWAKATGRDFLGKGIYMTNGWFVKLGTRRITRKCVPIRLSKLILPVILGVAY